MKKINLRKKRRIRIRKKVQGTSESPRISIFRSNKHIYVQAIDDENGITIASFNDKKIKGGKKLKKAEISHLVGKEFGKMLKKGKIERAVFDRSGYRYHGRVKEVAEGVRESGINF